MPSTAGPTTVLDARFSSESAQATSWAEAEAALAAAKVYWLSTVRPDGSPHVTPVIAVWYEGALYFSTGPTERKAKNLERNAACVLTTGSSALDHGLDLVVEGHARRVTDRALLGAVVEAYVAKYGEGWRFEVRDDALEGGGGKALLFVVEPVTVFGFGKGSFSQTRWRFEDQRRN